MPSPTAASFSFKLQGHWDSSSAVAEDDLYRQVEPMIERTVRTSVQFRRPFRLTGVEKILSPGIYEIETVEEALDSLSVGGYRRTSTTITLPGPTALSRQLTTISPEDLAGALDRDRMDGNDSSQV
jgi:hypothetical protein